MTEHEQDFAFGSVTAADRSAFFSAPPFTVADVVRARAADLRTGMIFDDQTWTYAEMVEAASARAGLILSLRRPGPLHVGLLLENVPEANLWLAAAALAGATIVPLNLTRRGAELASDIERTDCQVLVTDARFLTNLGEAQSRLSARVIDVSASSYRSLVASAKPLDSFAPATSDPSSTYLLGFTSGSSAGPKACIFTHRRILSRSRAMVSILKLTPEDVVYEFMPLFHNTGIAMAWLPSWLAGATQLMRPRFSASAFLSDVRRHGVTCFAYVGKVLAYILDTPEAPDDAQNTLVRGAGVEATAPDAQRFAERFGCAIRDAYGSTEGGVTIHRDDTTPPRALGRPVSPTTTIVDPDTGAACEVAEVDAAGRLLNADRAIGEIVDLAERVGFEGYYNNPAADAERVHDGYYWSGDLAFRDAEGWYYFAGRGADMIRVDGENLATSQVEAIMELFEPCLAAAAYGVPSATGSDDLMVCMQLHDGAHFDPARFATFLADQTDLGPKMVPRFVRITRTMPLTGSQKVDRRTLRDERLRTADPTWWRSGACTDFAPLTEPEADALAAEVRSRGRDIDDLGA